MSTPAEFEAWYSREHPRLVAMLTIVLGSASKAADATAEAFTRAYERWPRVCQMDSPSGWTYRVALNVARRKARREVMERGLWPRMGQREVVEPPDGIALDLWAAVQRLPRRQRAVVALRLVDDLPQAEVAKILGIKDGTVSASLAAACRSLRAELGNHPSHEWSEQHER